MPRRDMVRIRRGTSAEWAAADPVLADGELGQDTDTGVVKCGDGVDVWSALPPSGGEQTGNPGDPIILEPVKWLWSSFNWENYAAGTSGDISPRVGDVIRSTDQVWGDMNVALPAPISTLPALSLPYYSFAGTSAPLGSVANVAAGIQVGDRVLFDDLDFWGNTGIYVVTSLGSESEPWELQRADDLSESDSFREWVCLIDGVGRATHKLEEEPDDLYLSMDYELLGGSLATGGYSAIAGGNRSLAIGRGAIATGGSQGHAMAAGYRTAASAPYAHAFGYNAVASGIQSSAIGAYSVATEAGVTVVGGTASAGNGGAAVIQGVYGTITSSFTLSKVSMGRLIPCSHATNPITITIPTNASVAFPVGAMVELARLGAGAVSFAAAAGVTLLGTTTVGAVNSVVKARKIATNTWLCSVS